MTDTDHPELVEFEGETLGDTLTNLLTEVNRLREGIVHALILSRDNNERLDYLKELVWNE